MNSIAYIHVDDIRVQSPKARHEQRAALAAAEAASERRGAQAERARILAIITASEANHRFRTALHIALKTDMTVQQARDLLLVLGEGSA